MEEPKAQRGKGRSFFKKRDLLIIGAVLAAALVAWLVWGRGRGPAGAVAVVEIGYGAERATRRLDLGEDGTVAIDAALPVHLQIEDGAVRFVDSVCPDHDCEHMGWLRQSPDWAACLPAGVTVRIE